MNTLNRTSANKPVQHPERILQFGADSFSRGFCSWLFDKLNNQTDFSASIVCVSSEDDAKQLKAQEGLFHLALYGIQKGEIVSEVSLVESISRVIDPKTEWEVFLTLAEQLEMRYVVSSTSDRGIVFSEQDKFTDMPPKEYSAKLTLWLYRRFTYFKGAKDKGCVMLPCEQINNNGSTLRKVILQYAQKWNLGFDFQDWITESNHFCDTLVDRIVLGYPEDRVVSIQKKIGFEDPLMVAAEHYHNWVIKARSFVRRELPFPKTDLNVKFVEDISAYAKLRALIYEGSQLSLASLGVLIEMQTLSETLDDEIFTDYLNKLLSEELEPILKDQFLDKEIDEYIQSIQDRFANPVLEQQLSDISENGISKFKEMLTPAFLSYNQIRGGFPKRIALCLAAILFASSKDLFTDKNRIEEVVIQTISNIELMGEDLTVYDGLTSFIVKSIEQIGSEGIQKILVEL